MELLSILLLSSSAHYEPGSERVEVLLLSLGTIIWEKHRSHRPWEYHHLEQHSAVKVTALVSPSEAWHSDYCFVVTAAQADARPDSSP